MWPFTRRNSRIAWPDGIEARESPLHGQGVFARQAFNTGDLIEKAPVILLDQAEREQLQTTRLFQYYFLIGDPVNPVALGLGYSSLYNHASKANAHYTISLKESCLIIRACKPIKAQEEITLNYNGQPDDESPVIFPEVIP